MSRPVLRGALWCALLLASAGGADPAAASRAHAIGARIRDREAKLHHMHVQLGEKRAALHFARTQEADYRRQLTETDAAIGSADRRLRTLNGAVAWSRRRLAWNEVQLQAAEATLARHTGALRRRLVDMYESGDVAVANVLLSSHSFSDFVERDQDLSLLVAYNQRAIRERAAAKRDVERRHDELAEAHLRLAQTVEEAGRAKSRLASLSQERRNLVALSENRRVKVAREVADLDELSASEEGALRNDIAARQAALDAERRAAEAAGRPSSGPAHGSGEFSWPVRGQITSPFGWRSNPMGRGGDFHPGLDIAAGTGTPISAADGGRVMIAGWVSGYGNYVAIDHGGGVSTAYGHMSRLLVSPGQDVARGQVIGLVGSTGHSTGPHVHFEVRIHGEPVNPAARLP